jgi:hypothetical protein
MKYLNLMIVSLALALSTASLNAVAAKFVKSKEKVVMQVSDADTGKWNLALNNAKNVQQSYGADKIDIEIVVYGPGIGMLKADSAIGNRIDEAKAAGVKVVACENTMKANKLTKEDMLPDTSYVPSGVVELIKKERAGYVYIRP